MTAFLNGLLALYALDAGLSNADDILTLSTGWGALNPLRNTIALFTLAYAVVAYCYLACDQRAPKSILIPPLVMLFGITLLLPLIQQHIGQFSMNMTGAGLQAVMAVFTGVRLQRRYGRLYFRREDWHGGAFGWRSFFQFTGVNTMILIVVIPVAIYFSVQSAIAGASANFIRLDTSGIHLIEKQYQRDDTSIRLIPMIHIGEPDYYTAVGDSLHMADAAILTEGVSDDEELMTDFREADNAAGLFGLESQQIMSLPDVPMTADEFDETAVATQNERPVVINADVSSSDLRPSTRKYLNAVGAIVRDHESPMDSMTALYQWSARNVTPAEQSAIYRDILDKRNAVLLRHLRRVLSAFGTVMIPWGAMHMPGIEREVLALGFEQTGTVERRAIGFLD